jgi:hypothetical protein
VPPAAPLEPVVVLADVKVRTRACIARALCPAAAVALGPLTRVFALFTLVQSVGDLEALGLDQLKAELSARGLKCGCVGGASAPPPSPHLPHILVHSTTTPTTTGFAHGTRAPLPCCIVECVGDPSVWRPSHVFGVLLGCVGAPWPSELRACFR